MSPDDVNAWPEQAQARAEDLQRLLSIDDRQWHALKGLPRRRAAEQASAALVLLLHQPQRGGGEPGAEQNARAAELLEHAAAWLRGARKDPGCPHRPG